MKKILFIVFSLFFLSKLSYSQEKDSAAVYKYWITTGAWVDRVLTLNCSYSFSSGSNFYKVGYIRHGENFPFGGIDLNGVISNSVDVSIGKRYQTTWFQVSHFIGPCLVFGKKSISLDKNESFATAGIEMITQLLFRPANEVGIGFGLIGNINFEKSYAGLTINITLGNGK